MKRKGKACGLLKEKDSEYSDGKKPVQGSESDSASDSTSEESNANTKYRFVRVLESESDSKSDDSTSYREFYETECEVFYEKGTPEDKDACLKWFEKEYMKKGDENEKEKSKNTEEYEEYEEDEELITD